MQRDKRATLEAETKTGTDTMAEAGTIRGRFVLGETSSRDSVEELQNHRSSQENRFVSNKSYAGTRWKELAENH